MRNSRPIIQRPNETTRWSNLCGVATFCGTALYSMKGSAPEIEWLDFLSAEKVVTAIAFGGINEVIRETCMLAGRKLVPARTPGRMWTGFFVGTGLAALVLSANFRKVERAVPGLVETSKELTQSVIRPVVKKAKDFYHSI